MKPGEYNGQAVRQQLERIISSGGFSRNERLSRFLRLVVERQLEGKGSELKESLIAVEVFGRKPDYDPKLDPTVRTEAIRLRARLSHYYGGEGSKDAVIIELPKGGYAPVFRLRSRLGKRLWLAVALVGLAVALLATGRWWAWPKSEPIVIAVLPLENLSHDPANDYFADGLTDELIRNLSVIEGLAVRSRTSSFAFKPRFTAYSIVSLLYTVLETQLLASARRAGSQKQALFQLSDLRGGGIEAAALYLTRVGAYDASHDPAWQKICDLRDLRHLIWHFPIVSSAGHFHGSPDAVQHDPD